MSKRTLTRMALVLSVAGLATGCATSNPTRTPLTTAAASQVQWSAAAAGVTASGAAADLSHWWQQLGDDQLSSLVEQALQNSPDIRTATARLAQARAERNLAAAGLLPSVNGGLTSSARRNGNESVSTTIDASWEPDLSGRLRRAVGAADAELRASSDDVHGVQVSLAGDVARTYAELRTLQARLAVARDNETSQQETVSLTGFRVQAGLVSSLDLEQARANLEQTRAQLPTLEASAAQAIHRLSTLVGREPAALDAQLRTVGRVPPVPSAVAINIPAETLRQRPDVRAAEARVVAAGARIAQAQAARRPRFSLSGTFGSNLVGGAIGGAITAGLTGVSGGASLVASLAGTFTQVIFDGGRIRQQIAIQTAAEEQAVATYEATVLTALRDVEDALVSFEQSRRRLDALNAAAAAANTAALLAQTQYAAGLTDFQNVLTTQRTVLTVQDAVATTTGDRLTALVQLYKALGGGWAPTPDDMTSGRTS